MHAPDQNKIIAEVLNTILESDVEIIRLDRVGGGSINQTFRVKSTAGVFFVKVNSDLNANAMFDSEQDGLKGLSEFSQFPIPEVFGITNHSGCYYLIMEYIEPQTRTSSFWETLGEQLAEMHRSTALEFGYHRTNYIGSLVQSNAPATTWEDFFIKERIVPMLIQARDRGLVDSVFINRVEAALPDIVALMPNEKPAFLHGDLWSGNLIVDSNGGPTLIDPAVYYGHREMDLAFSQLFGGFSDRFYQSYHDAFPLESDFSDRVELYNLYPLLVHLNLFGHAYLGQIQMTIARFR